MTTAREPATGPAPAGQPAQPREPEAASNGREQAAAPPLAHARPDVTGPGPQENRAVRPAEERAQRARSVGCPCHAAPGVPCEPSGDHLARYLHAHQSGAITRQALRDVIEGLDVIAPQVLIQPPGDRAAHTAGGETADQAARAQPDTRTSGRIPAPAEPVPLRRSGQPTAAPPALNSVHGQDALRTGEVGELEAGA